MAADPFAGFDGSKTLSLKWSSRLQHGPLRSSVSRNGKRVLGRTGAYSRKVMKNSIKSRKRGSSPPGTPPYSHTGLLKQFILYQVLGDESVIIGAALLPRMRPQSVSAPELLEQGGVVTRLARGRGGTKRTQRAHYQPRPFAKPALGITTERLAHLLAEN